MKLTAEQWVEVMLALMFGCSNAAWEGLAECSWAELNPDRQKAVLATLHERMKRQIAEIGAVGSAAEHNAQLLTRFNLESIAEENRREAAMREALLNSCSKKSAKRLEQDVSEVLSQVLHFSSDQVRAVNRRLAARKLPLLAELSGKLSRRRAAILKRGKIRNDDEYYVVKEIICDQASDVPDPDREKFEAMFGAYEVRKKKPE